MRLLLKPVLFASGLLTIVLGFNLPLFAADAPASGKVEKVETSALKRKYLDSDNSQDLTVVQNRIYTKKYKFNFSPYWTTISHDVFLNTTGVGAHLGFSLSEVFTLEGFYYSISDSSASSVVEAVKDAVSGQATVSPNVNPISSIVGGQLAASLLYGKLSFFGIKILHFDLYLSGGLSLLSTSQTNLIGTKTAQSIAAPTFGIGQQIFLMKWLSVRFDYRLLFYSEKLYNSNSAAVIAATNSPRSVTASMVTLGLNFLFL